MRHLAVVVTLLLCVVETGAEAGPPRNSSGGRSNFGAPVVIYTRAGDQGALMLGGRGGWNVTPGLLVGFGAYGTVTEIDAPAGALPDSLGPIDTKFETFGIDLEYAAHPVAPTHLTLTAFFGGAAIHYMPEKTEEQYGETDFTVLVQPAVGAEQRVTGWLHLNLALSYRLVSGVELSRLRGEDINGPSVALAFKIGRF